MKREKHVIIKKTNYKSSGYIPSLNLKKKQQINDQRERERERNRRLMNCMSWEIKVEEAAARRLREKVGS